MRFEHHLAWLAAAIVVVLLAGCATDSTLRIEVRDARTHEPAPDLEVFAQIPFVLEFFFRPKHGQGVTDSHGTVVVDTTIRTFREELLSIIVTAPDKPQQNYFDLTYPRQGVQTGWLTGHALGDPPSRFEVRVERIK